MNNTKKIFVIFLLFIACENNVFGQFRYFVKLFQSNDKKIIEIVEENNRAERQIVGKVENEKAYTDYKRKLKEEKETEIAIPGIYKTRSEFLSLKKYSTESLIEELEKESERILSSGSKTGAEEVKSTAVFKRGGFLSEGKRNKQNFGTETKFSKERNSLKNVSKVQVYISIPETPQEFKNIFKSINNDQLNSSKLIKRTIKNEKNPNVHFLANSDLLSNEILHSPENMPIILIGHNEGGGFRFPDGTKEKIEKIDSVVSLATRSIVYLSCNSNTFTSNPAANFYLTYKDGIAITNRINSAFLEDGDITKLKETVTNILEKYQKDKNQMLKYKIVISSIAISGISYTIYEVKQGDRKIESVDLKTAVNKRFGKS